MSTRPIVFGGSALRSAESVDLALLRCSGRPCQRRRNTDLGSDASWRGERLQLGCVERRLELTARLGAFCPDEACTFRLQPRELQPDLASGCQFHVTFQAASRPRQVDDPRRSGVAPSSRSAAAKFTMRRVAWRCSADAGIERVAFPFHFSAIIVAPSSLIFRVRECATQGWRRLMPR
jgi:hypothetical protein